MNKLEELEKAVLMHEEALESSKHSVIVDTQDLEQAKKDLANFSKPEVTSEFLDKISETICEAVENLELDDGVTCDFEIGYDNKVEMSDVRFEDTHAVAEKIYCAVEKLFAEVSSDIYKAQKADEACN